MTTSSKVDQLQAGGLDRETAAVIRKEITSAIEAAFQSRTAAAVSPPPHAEQRPTASGSRADWMTPVTVVSVLALILVFFYWQITGIKEAMRSGFDSIRAENTAGFASIRAEMKTGFADIRTEIANYRTEMNTGFADIRAEIESFRSDAREDNASIRAEVSGIREKVSSLNERMARLEALYLNKLPESP